MRVMEHKIQNRNEALNTVAATGQTDGQDEEEEDDDELASAKQTSPSYGRQEQQHDVGEMKAEVIGMLEDKQLAEGLLRMIEDTGLKIPLQDLYAMIRDTLKLKGRKQQDDCELLNESILYQYAYLEKLIRSCKDEKDPRGPSQKLLRGNDHRFNASLSEARDKVT